MEKEFVQGAIEQLSVLQDDGTIPKNVKSKIGDILTSLNQNVDISLRVHRALQLLEEIGEDINVEPYTRMQILNIVSELEKISVS